IAAPRHSSGPDADLRTNLIARRCGDFSLRAARASALRPPRCASKSRPLRFGLSVLGHKLSARPRPQPCHRVLPTNAAHSPGFRFLAFSWRHAPLLKREWNPDRARETSAVDTYQQTNNILAQFRDYRRAESFSIELIFGPAVLDRHVLTLDITGVLEALAKRAQTARVNVRRSGVKEADHRHHRLRRPPWGRPRGRRAAEQRDELSPLHSITSSARASTVGGTSRPRA